MCCGHVVKLGPPVLLFFNVCQEMEFAAIVPGRGMDVSRARLEERGWSVPPRNALEVLPVQTVSAVSDCFLEDRRKCGVSDKIRHI
jgi:hypothetical protein